MESNSRGVNYPAAATFKKKRKEKPTLKAGDVRKELQDKCRRCYRAFSQLTSITVLVAVVTVLPASTGAWESACSYSTTAPQHHITGDELKASDEGRGPFPVHFVLKRTTNVSEDESTANDNVGSMPPALIRPSGHTSYR